MTQQRGRDTVSDAMTSHKAIEAVIDDTPEAVAAAGHYHGSELIVLSREHIEALLAGKLLAIAINDGEYRLFLAGE